MARASPRVEKIVDVGAREGVLEWTTSATKQPLLQDEISASESAVNEPLWLVGDNPDATILAPTQKGTYVRSILCLHALP